MPTNELELLIRIYFQHKFLGNGQPRLFQSNIALQVVKQIYQTERKQGGGKYSLTTIVSIIKIELFHNDISPIRRRDQNDR